MGEEVVKLASSGKVSSAISFGYISKSEVQGALKWCKLTRDIRYIGVALSKLLCKASCRKEGLLVSLPRC